jgi:hypothetical protein
MDASQRIERLQAEGFNWKLFGEYFPFGDVTLREGNYQRLLEQCLRCLESDAERVKLLNLLDIQGCAFLEQMWSINEMLENEDTEIGMAAHFCAAWLQINSNFRHEYGLGQTSARQIMMNLDKDDSLMGRLARGS